MGGAYIKYPNIYLANTELWSADWFFVNFENELFTIFIKNFNTLELTLGTEVNSIVHCCWCRAVSTEGVSCQDCWHDTTTATMWGSGTNVMRPD
jgi:hypothetical protein